METKIQNADDYRCNRKNDWGNIRIHQPIQIVEQERALCRLDSGPAFEPVFQQSQGTRPRKEFRKDSPKKRNDMQPPENRTRTCQQSAEDYPQNKEYVHE